MPVRFHVLASGSGGNSTLIEANGQTVLLDLGLGPRTLGGRLGMVNSSWGRIQAALLTHTHADHWKNRTLHHLAKKQIPLYCHADHHECLAGNSSGFDALLEAGLVRHFCCDEEFLLFDGFSCRPVELSHDGGTTVGFQFEIRNGLFGPSHRIGYLADLGCWSDRLVEAMLDVDVLALEFNHDVVMERTSGRSPYLIQRVLSDLGHLSNEQAARFLKEVLARSSGTRLQHVVQLHLSRDCNRPGLAAQAAKTVVAELAADLIVHTALQDEPSVAIHLGVATGISAPRAARKQPKATTAAEFFQPWLPGLEMPGLEA